MKTKFKFICLFLESEKKNIRGEVEIGLEGFVSMETAAADAAFHIGHSTNKHRLTHKLTFIRHASHPVVAPNHITTPQPRMNPEPQD